MQIRQKRCTISTSKARASERQLKRKNTRAPCRIRREGITCRGVVPFAFRRRRDVLFFSFFLRKNETGQWPSRFFVFVGLNGRGSHPRALFVRDPFTVVRGGRACPARSLAIVSPLSFASEGGVLTPPGASGTPPPTTIRRASHYRKRPRRPGGRPPYIPLYHIPWGGPSPATHSRHPVGAGHARPAASPLPPRILCIVGRQATGPCPLKHKNNLPATSRRQVVFLVPFLLRKGTNPRLVKITSGQSPQPRRPAPAGPAGSARPSGR